jgi:foldase protein PrsA
MKKLILAGVMISALGLSACSSSTVMKSDAGNVTTDELYQAMKDKYGTQTLQQLAMEKVLSKYTVSKSEIDAAVKKTKDQLGSNYLTTLQQYGYTNENAYRESVKLSLEEQKAIYKTIKVTDKELKDAYASYKPDIQASHILVSDEKTAQDIETKLKNGAKFEDLAKQYSQDTASAANGGDLGWFGTGAMDADFEKAAFALKVNQISSPVQTQYGYHIIKVTGIKEKESFSKLKSTLTNQVKESKVTDAIAQKVLKEEFKKANVSISDKALKKAADFSSTVQSTN